MNLADIAREAGVSVATVSKAFSGAKDVGADTRERIFAVAKQHGCFDHYNKNKFEKPVIAVLTPELSEHYTAITGFLDREITALGGIMVESMTGFSPEREQELFQYYTGYAHVDGIILIDERGEIQNTTQVPAVAFHRKKRRYIDNIVLDFDRGVEDAVRYLKEMGHTDIGFAGEQLTTGKQDCFCRAMRKVGLPLQKKRIKTTATRFEMAGEELAAAWLREGDLPTALITSYDHIAIGAIRYFRRHGVRVPEDISVIGMDDIPVAPSFDYSLTSIRVPTEAACCEAVKLLFKKLQNQHYSTRQSIVLNTAFVARETTGKAPKK